MAWMIVSDSSCEIRELERPAAGAHNCDPPVQDILPASVFCLSRIYIIVLS